MSDASDEIDRLRALRLDSATASLQRKMIRSLVWASVALVLAGQVIAWRAGEQVQAPREVGETLRGLPSGHALMMLGLLLGIATPVARGLLLMAWFARRRERAMALIAALVVAIVLSGLLLRH